MSAPFVVFGAGQIGTQVAQQLLAAGNHVRQARRSGGDRREGNFELCTGDLTDFTFVERLAAGAQALIHCASPPYHQWAEQLAPLNDAVLHAAKRSGAPLVVLDNLYGYGEPGAPLTETSAVNPCSRKGELRARVAQTLQAAHVAGDARVAIARAADFYGPGITQAAIFGERFLYRALAGKNLECFGPPELLHSYSYGPDVAAGLVTLAKSARAWGEVWHLPVAAASSTSAMAQRFGRELGVDLKATVVPGFLLRVMGWFTPAVKELLEMRYQWRVPFVLDDAKFRAAFKRAPTSLDDGVRETVRWAKAELGAARS